MTPIQRWHCEILEASKTGLLPCQSSLSSPYTSGKAKNNTIAWYTSGWHKAITLGGNSRTAAQQNCNAGQPREVERLLSFPSAKPISWAGSQQLNAWPLSNMLFNGLGLLSLSRCSLCLALGQSETYRKEFFPLLPVKIKPYLHLPTGHVAEFKAKYHLVLQLLLPLLQGG